MELAGKVIAITEARSGKSATTGNEWKVQEYVIETHEQYPRRMAFEVFGEDKLRQFNIQMGEEINVSFDINAREWNGRWYNSIRAWKVDRVAAGAPADNVGASLPAAEPGALESTDSADDLPF